MWLKLLPFLFLMACSSTQKTEMNTNTNDLNRLHDIWALQTMNGEDVPKDLSKMPVLEIFVETKKIAGNDGCNNFSGPIKTLTENELKFGMLMGTKMACPNMVFTRGFNSNLGATASYVLKGLTLVLMDKDNKELMSFKKVD